MALKHSTLALAIALIACDGRPATQTIVRVSAERITARRTHEVIVRVTNQEDESRLEQTVTLQGDGADTSFPLTIPLVPRGGDASRVYRVEVEAFDETDRKFNESRVISGYVADQLREIRVRLEDQCIEITCPADQTCRDGDCIDARVDPLVPPAEPDAPIAIAPLTGTALHRTLRPELRWRSSGEVERYEVQLTDECGAGGIASCPFARATTATTSATTWRPEADLAIATSPPVGARYTWRVRACNGDACSAYTAPRYVDVGRYGHDYDGDGFSDLLVGANQQMTAGRAYAFHGGAGGLSTTPTTELIPPAGASEFSLAITDGDVDGDGYCDALIGAFLADGGRGSVTVYRGGPGGLEPTSTAIVRGPGTDAIQLGHSLSMGDVDADGFADLIVGAYVARIDTVPGGSVLVFEGAEDGSFRADPWLTIPSPVPTAGGLFGWAVLAIDLDGDGADEVVAGAPDQADRASYSGIAWIFSGGSPIPRETLHVPGSGENELFGRALARAQGDSGHVLLVGAPTFAAQQGSVFAYPGDSDLGAIGDAPSAYLPSAVPDVSWFGVAIASGGDVDGDGRDELVTGARSQAIGGRVEEGAAYVSSLQADGRPVADATQLTIGAAGEADAWFGTSVSISGDYDGDGLADVVVSAPHANVGAASAGGAVCVFRGRRGGALPSVPDLRIDNPLAADGTFGTGLVTP